MLMARRVSLGGDFHAHREFGSRHRHFPHKLPVPHEFFTVISRAESAIASRYSVKYNWYYSSPECYVCNRCFSFKYNTVAINEISLIGPVNGGDYSRY